MFFLWTNELTMTEFYWFCPGAAVARVRMGRNLPEVSSRFPLHVVACKPCSSLPLQSTAWGWSQKKGRPHEAAILHLSLSYELLLLHRPELSLPFHYCSLLRLLDMEGLCDSTTNRRRDSRLRTRIFRLWLVDYCSFRRQPFSNSRLCYTQFVGWLHLDCLHSDAISVLEQRLQREAFPHCFLSCLWC